VPVLAGFGVANATQARELSSHGDGVIVGSKIVQLFHEEKATEVRTLIQESLPKNNDWLIKSLHEIASDMLLMEACFWGDLFFNLNIDDIMF